MEINMDDEFLIFIARALVNQQRPLPNDTVMKLNIIARRLEKPTNELDSLYKVAIKDMNIASMVK